MTPDKTPAAAGFGLALKGRALRCLAQREHSRTELERSPHVGAIFETFVASELVKQQVHAGRARELYFFRDDEGLEVDFIRSRDGGGVQLIEAMWTRTPRPEDARGLAKVSARFPPGMQIDAVLLHRGGGSAPDESSLAPGIAARTVDRFFVREASAKAQFSARSGPGRPRPSRRGRPPSAR